MWPARFALLAALSVPHAIAGIHFTSVVGGDSVAVGAGPSSITIEWTDSGSEPRINRLGGYVLDLCAGTDDSFVSVKTITSRGLFLFGNVAKGVILPRDGGDTRNAYFFRITSAGLDGRTYTDYSPRFTLSGMTGSFPPPVQEALDADPITDTDAPRIAHDDSRSVVGREKRQGGAAIGVGAAATAVAADSFTVPYTMQTGLTKYAPMQRAPGSKITKRTPSPQYPTSAYEVYATYAPRPTQVTTVTHSGTFTTSSREATQAAAPMPLDDMARFLARWKD